MEDSSEKYIQGKLPEKEHSTFEGKLSEEESKEMAFELGVKSGVELAVKAELKSKVAQFERRRSSRKIAPWQLGVAASILLIATLTFLLKNGSQGLYEEYYSPYPNFEVTVLRGEDEGALIAQAYKAYDEAKYGLAAEKFAEFLEQNSENVPSRFFYGVTLMEAREFDAAITNFNLVFESDPNDYVDAARWYAALSFIKIGDHTSAISLLDQLENSDDFGERAKKLKQQL